MILMKQSTSPDNHFFAEVEKQKSHKTQINDMIDEQIRLIDNVQK